jgi:membrane associated rhomboid family serine protease
MIYMQVDVPMERLPIANWALMAVTIVCSALALIGENRHDRRIAAIEDEVGERMAIAQDLNDPHLTPARRKELESEIRRHDEELRRRIMEVPAPFQKYGLAVDRDDFHVYQLVTHMFLHLGFWHLFGNMLFLFCFGNAIDAKLGHLWFLATYLGLGIFAGIIWYILGPAPAVGASGAIMGLTGVFLVLYPLNEVAIWDLWYMRLTGDLLRIPSWMFIAAYMALDLYGAFAEHASVGYIAHVAGEAAGFGIAAALVMTGLVQSSRGERSLLEIWGWIPPYDERPRRKKRRPRVSRPKRPIDDEI